MGYAWRVFLDCLPFLIMVVALLAVILVAGAILNLAVDLIATRLSAAIHP